MANYKAHPSVPTRLIHLHSEHAVMGRAGYTTDCSWTLQSPIQCSDKQTFLLTPISCILPNSLYSVNERNNVLSAFVYGGAGMGVPHDFILPVGNYTVDTFATMLQDLISAYTTLGGEEPYDTLTVQYIESLGKFELNLTDNIALGLLVDGSTAKELVGLTENTVIMGNDQPEILGGVANMNSLSAVAYVRSTILRQYTAASTITQRGVVTDSDIILKVSMTSPPNNYVFFTGHDATSQQSILQQKSIDTIDLRLTDRNGTLYNLNGLHWSITLRVDVIDK